MLLIVIILREEYRQKNFKAPADLDGGIHQHRALLLSGPPGIGKTTTAIVVARTHGYEPLEFNASDTRNKKRLQVREYFAESCIALD